MSLILSDVKDRILYTCVCLGLYVLCFGVNVYKCAHEHLSMLEGQG